MYNVQFLTIFGILSTHRKCATIWEHEVTFPARVYRHIIYIVVKWQTDCVQFKHSEQKQKHQPVSKHNNLRMKTYCGSSFVIDRQKQRENSEAYLAVGYKKLIPILMGPHV
jgi:predicted adenine nucleotide alpha hydrolase (AANH) superfamily ATPase